MATQTASGVDSLIDLGDDHPTDTTATDTVINEQLQNEAVPLHPIVNSKEPDAVPHTATITNEPVQVETSIMQPLTVSGTATVVDATSSKALEEHNHIVDPLTTIAPDVSHKQTQEYLQEPTHEQAPPPQLTEQTSIPHPLLDEAQAPTEQTASDLDTAHLSGIATELKTANAGTPQDANLNTTVETVRNYLDSTVVPVLRQAMRELCIKRPEDPYTFLADFIMAHKPKNGQ